MIRHLIRAGLLALGTAGMANAADPVGTPVQGDILQGWKQADGSRVVAIRLTLADGWKTYWRAPGDSGIPPQIDWKGSQNLDGVALHWPAPSVFREGSLTTIGYKHELILPISLQPRSTEAPIRLHATLDIGVCSDICVPQTLQLDAVIDTDITRPTPAIAAALAARPYSAAEAGAGPATCTLRPGKHGLEIEARVALPDTGGREMIVIEPGQPNLWISESDTSRSGATVTGRADVAHVKGGAIALDRSAIRITVLGDRHAVDIQGCMPG